MNSKVAPANSSKRLYTVSAFTIASHRYEVSTPFPSNEIVAMPTADFTDKEFVTTLPFNIEEYPHFMALQTVKKPNDLGDIEDYYIISEPETVFKFLRNHQGLSDLLLQAYKKLDELFGPNPQVELTLFSDPEAPELPQTLFGYVRTRLPVPEAIAKFDEFDETWFLDAVRHVNANLNFSLRFL
jgi:hypothetical protein